MSKKLSITIVSTVVAATVFLNSNSLSAQMVITPKDTFVGLWQGVDEVDGGNSLRSILPSQFGLKVVGRDTWHGPCGYGDPATVLGQLNVSQESLVGTWNLDCQAGETTQSGDRSYKVRYTYDPATKTLTETLLDPNTEKPINRIPIVFFRIAPSSTLPHR